MLPKRGYLVYAFFVLGLARLAATHKCIHHELDVHSRTVHVHYEQHADDVSAAHEAAVAASQGDSGSGKTLKRQNSGVKNIRVRFDTTIALPPRGEGKHEKAKKKRKRNTFFIFVQF